MTQVAKPQEPSMEEILASIRRIIADDDASKAVPRPAEPAVAARAAPPPPRPAAAAPPPEAKPEPYAQMPTVPHPAAPQTAEAEDQSSDILDLTDSMAVSPPAPAAPNPAPVQSSPPPFRRIDGHSDVDFDEAGEKLAAQRTGEGMRRQFARETGERGDERAQLISSDASAAIDSAFNTLAQTVLVQNARTLEDLVREMLRPLLKAWLDDNLPAMVERLVRAEIERVSRGRTS